MNSDDNPYRPGAGITPPSLIGRDDVLQEFEIALRRTIKGRPGKSVVPIGLRGVGKTVLLNRFVEMAEQYECSVAYFEAPESGTFSRSLATELRKILAEFDRLGAASEFVTKAIGTLKSFHLSISPEGAPSFSLGVDPLQGFADSGILAEDFKDLFVSAAKAARARNKCIVIAIDELQYLNENELAAIITALHRTNQLDLPLVFVATGLPSIPMLAGNAKSYAERMFSFPRIGALSPIDARAAIEGPSEKNGVVFSPEALDAIVELSKGYPYFIQEWAYTAWNAATISPIPRSTVDAVASTVQESLDKGFFTVRFDRLTPTEKRYLRAMSALGTGPHRSGDIASHLGSNAESLSTTRSGLIKKGMIYSPAHGDTAFTVPLFDEFMRRAIPEESLPLRPSKNPDSRRPKR